MQHNRRPTGYLPAQRKHRLSKLTVHLHQVGPFPDLDAPHMRISRSVPDIALYWLSYPAIARRVPLQQLQR